MRRVGLIGLALGTGLAVAAMLMMGCGHERDHDVTVIRERPVREVHVEREKNVHVERERGDRGERNREREHD